MQNPFTIGIAQAGDLCNRQRELNDLVRYAKNGQSVVLYAPRRFGKSSLAIQALRQLSGEGFLTAYIDLFPISSEQDFISRFAAGIIKGIGKGADPRSFKDRVSHLFGRFIPSIEIRPEGAVFSMNFDRNTKPEFLLADLIQGIYRYLENKKVRACIALDEFQEITDLGESKRIEGILRSHIQFHKEAAFFFIGSRRRILQDMFTNKNRPFYKSAFLYTLGEISKEDFTPYIVQKFVSSGKMCSAEAAMNIFEMAKGYPYYVQKLSSLAWDRTQEACDLDTIRAAYSLLLETEAPDFESIWSGLTLIQKAVLHALAEEPTPSPFAKDYLKKYGLSIGGAQKAIKTLLARDLIEKETGYRLTDPIMGVWLTHARED